MRGSSGGLRPLSARPWTMDRFFLWEALGLVGRQAEPTLSPVLPPGKHLVRRNIQEVWELLHWIVKLSGARRYHLCKLTTELAAWAGKGASADGPAPEGVPGRLKAKNHLHPPSASFSGCEAYLENLWETERSEWETTGWEEHTTRDWSIYKTMLDIDPNKLDLIKKKKKLKPKKIRLFFSDSV